MRHDISTTAAHTGHGAWVGNQARAIHARHAQAADTILSFHHIALPTGTLCVLPGNASTMKRAAFG